MPLPPCDVIWPALRYAAEDYLYRKPHADRAPASTPACRIARNTRLRILGLDLAVVKGRTMQLSGTAQATRNAEGRVIDVEFDKIRIDFKARTLVTLRPAHFSSHHAGSHLPLRMRFDTMDANKASEWCRKRAPMTAREACEAGGLAMLQAYCALADGVVEGWPTSFPAGAMCALDVQSIEILGHAGDAKPPIARLGWRAQYRKWNPLRQRFTDLAEYQAHDVSIDEALTHAMPPHRTTGKLTEQVAHKTFKAFIGP